MKVLLLGATGRTGRYILEELMDQGYEVACLVRDSTKLGVTSKTLKIYEGNPTKPDDLRNAIDGCEFLISALNISRKSDFPWSGLRTPKTFLSDTIKNIEDLHHSIPLERLVVCSAWGVGETRSEIPFWFRWTIDFSNISHAYIDHQRVEKLLEKSAIPWTVVRPAGLINSSKVAKVVESNQGNPRPKLTIGRRLVAKYMVNALSRDDLIHKAPVISSQLFGQLC